MGSSRGLLGADVKLARLISVGVKATHGISVRGVVVGVEGGWEHYFAE